MPNEVKAAIGEYFRQVYSDCQTLAIEDFDCDFNALSPEEAAGLEKPFSIEEICFVWSIWLIRNDIVFKSSALDQNHLLDLCILRLSLWCKAKWPDTFPGSSTFVQDPFLFQEYDRDLLLPLRLPLDDGSMIEYSLQVYQVSIDVLSSCLVSY
ncbi:hypothetical protein V6N13_035621 [Hibiscus sabdariffa]